MTLKDLITKKKPGAKVEIVILNTDPEWLHDAERFLNCEVEAINPDIRIDGDCLKLEVWLKEGKTKFDLTEVE